VADVNKRACDTDLLDTLSKRVVMGGGAMSSRDEIRSAANWLSLVTTTSPTRSASCRTRALRSPRGWGRSRRWVGRPHVGRVTT